MGKDKLKRFAQMKVFPHVFEPSFESLESDGFQHKGQWNKEFFKRDAPIVLELGCGKGEYTVGLSRIYPERNYVGMDIKGARMWRGALTILENKQTNAAFVRTRLGLIERFYGQNEVDEIWITFPDPQPRKSRAKKRLTSPEFLDRYRKLLKPGGIINLKTDNYPLYLYSLEVAQEQGLEILASTDDLYGEFIPELKDEKLKEALNIKTTYEQIFSDKGFDINYLSFRLK